MSPTEHTTATENGAPSGLIIALPVALVLLIAVSFLVMKARWPGAFVPPRGQKSISTNVLSRHELDQLLLYRFRSHDSKDSVPGKLQPDQHCSICTEAFKNKVILRQLTCGHSFHSVCIDPWLLKQSTTCPLWYV